MGGMSYFKELQDLEDQGIDLVELLGQDRYLESPEALGRIIEQLSRSGENLYTELLYYLTYRRFPADQAESLWRAIMKHKGRLSDALGRKVSFRVAALDYLSSRTQLLRGVRLIGKPEFEGILSYVNVDEVTGVHNRRYFNDILAQEFHRARRYESPLSLLILDVDDFKSINDTFGHPEGDAVLRKIGRLLKDSTRQPDTVCRYGGDEFAVILPQTPSVKARALAERVRKAAARLTPGPAPGEASRWPQILRDAVGRDAARREGGPRDPFEAEAQPRDASLRDPSVRDPSSRELSARDPSSRELSARAGEPLTVTCSLGGATFPTDCEEAEELVAIADQLCLDAKRKGKNRVEMASGGGELSAAAE